MQRYDVQVEQLGRRIADLEQLSRARALTDQESQHLESLIRRQNRARGLHHAQQREARRAARLAA